MINYLVTREQRGAMDIFRSAEPALSGRVVERPYETALQETALTPGVYIFSDLDHLSEAQLRAAIDLSRRLNELGPSVRVLNDPARVLSRYELLRVLHDEGINRFNVFGVPDSLPSEPPAELRFPVFLRDREHTGSRTGLLHSWEETRAAIGELLTSERLSAEDLLIVEWCDTSDRDGVFHKFGAFVIGETIVARELLFSRHWAVKDWAFAASECLAEARAYIAENPHVSVLSHIARLANMNYGRFDYALVDGRPQVFEIDTNPMVITYPPGQSRVSVDRLSLELHRVPMRRIATALAALDDATQHQTTESASGLSNAAAST